jgi:hypothetical protein
MLVGSSRDKVTKVALKFCYNYFKILQRRNGMFKRNIYCSDCDCNANFSIITRQFCVCIFSGKSSVIKTNLHFIILYCMKEV